ncbi:MAG: anion permease [Candidatus Thermoplasmatota archaeon]|nr:anion permease [Candidatus Thermoplasmatota archaeon]
MALLTVLLVLAFIAAMYMAWTIGANDVANAMGTSVGSGAVTLKKAIIIAGIFDLLGAILVGSHVTATIKDEIIDLDSFTGDNGKMIVLSGMFAALLGTAIFMTIATYFKLPVSTGHGIVGGVVGFGLISSLIGEMDITAINGYKLLEISASWVISPLAGGVLAFVLFAVIKRYVLHSDNVIRAVKRMSPLFVGVVFFILSLSIIYKGLAGLGLDTVPFTHALLVSAEIGVLSGLVCRLLVRDLRLKKGESDFDMVERIFGFLLIITSCYIAFAHGASDVSHAIGPLAAVISIYFNDPVSSVPLWILIVGGAVIVLGIYTWGYKVMETMGRSITKITPSRGFAATFGAATSVLICSKLGLPISTSHCAVGGVVGVGFVKGAGSIDFKVLKKIGLSWIITIPAAAFLSVVIFLIIIAVT